jgi:serine/threonine protein kinase
VNVNRERWQQVSRLYHEAVKHPESARNAFLEEACGADESLRSEVLSLLHQQVSAEWMLREGAGAASENVPSIDGDLVGQRLGSYEIAALLGAGGMGKVYRARDTKLGREVALKVLHSEVAGDLDRLAYFDREARLLAKLNHPNIAAIYGIEENDRIRALVLELVEGDTLAQRLRERGPLLLAEALRVALQILKALEAAHAKGIIHRDLKPANIKVTADGTAKVLDFGIAKAIRPAAVQIDDSTTVAFAAASTALIVGTPRYMSPEQARGADIDERADVWAFGCVLYEMLTGRAAFARAPVAATSADGEVDWNSLPSGLPSQLVSILKQCLEPTTSRRIRYVRDLRSQLDSVESSIEDGERHSTRTRRWWPRVRLQITIGVSVGVAILAVLVWERTPQLPSDTGAPTVPARSPAADSLGPSSGVSPSVPPAPDPGLVPPAATAPRVNPTPPPQGATASPDAGMGQKVITPDKIDDVVSNDDHAWKTEIPELLKKYCPAVMSLDPQRMKEIMPSANVNELRRQYNQYQSITCEMAPEREKVQLDATKGTAHVRVVIRQAIVMKSGGIPQVNETIVDMTLVRPEVRTAWHIAKFSARPKP